MGRAKLALKQYDDAIDCYNQAIEVDPKKETTIRSKAISCLYLQ